MSHRLLNRHAALGTANPHRLPVTTVSSPRRRQGAGWQLAWMPCCVQGAATGSSSALSWPLDFRVTCQDAGSGLLAVHAGLA